MKKIHYDLPPSPFFICVEGSLDSDQVCLVGSPYRDMRGARRTAPRVWEHYRHRLKQGAGIEDADLNQIKKELESARHTLPRECQLTQMAISQLGFD